MTRKVVPLPVIEALYRLNIETEIFNDPEGPERYIDFGSHRVLYFFYDFDGEDHYWHRFANAAKVGIGSWR